MATAPVNVDIDKVTVDAVKNWDLVIQTYKNYPNICNWTDDKKIEYFMNKFKTFYTEYPVVCRYMVLLGKFNPIAFKEYLQLKQLDSKNIQPNREKGASEEAWIRRETDYVALLWCQNNNKIRKHSAEYKQVWQTAYKSLKKEFKDFRDNYSQLEQSVKTRRDNGHIKKITELIKRLTTDNNECATYKNEDIDIGSIRANQQCDEMKEAFKKEILYRLQVKLTIQNKRRMNEEFMATYKST